MNRPNIVPILILAALAWWMFSGTSAEPDTAAQAAARQAVQQFARDLSRIAGENAGMEPDKAAANSKAKTIPAYDAALLPLNTLIDESIKAGKFAETMSGASMGFAEAVK